MMAIGESKKKAKESGEAFQKIYSYETYRTYGKHTKYFITWLNQNHPEVTTLKKARKYVSEWLQYRVDQELSAWTITTEQASLNKLFGIRPEDHDWFEPPKRHRADIKRSRVPVANDRRFSVTNNDEFIKFCRGTGLRRSEIGQLRGKDLMSRKEISEAWQALARKGRPLPPQEEQLFHALQDALRFENPYFVIVRKGKGGRMRISPVIGDYGSQIVSRMQNTQPEEKVWLHVPCNADIHSYRSDYATAIYKGSARRISDIPYDKVRSNGIRYQSEVYACRKDEAGRKLDKAAMLLCSKALGHNRLEVVANNYLRGL